MANYDKSSIRTATKLEPVRLRPNNYIVDKEVPGQFHMIKEIIDNSNDELVLTKNGLLEIVLFNDAKNNSYQVMISDNGRGIPIEKLEETFTVLNTSGKFDTESYKFSSGSFGVGAKAAAALSKRFKAITSRDNKVSSILIEDGDGENVVISLDNSSDNKTGSFIVLEPDKIIFEDIDKFLIDGKVLFIELFSIWCLFVKYNIVIKEYKSGIDESFWKSGAKESLELLRDRSYSANVIFDSSTRNKDKDRFIKNYFNILRPMRWKMTLQQDPIVPSILMKEDELIAYDINIYAIKYENQGNHVSIANNVIVKDNDSTHLEVLNKLIKDKLAPFIKEKPKYKFFVEKYHLPLYYLAHIRYNDIEYKNLHKTGIKDKKFKKTFSTLIEEQLSGFDDQFEELFEIIEPDLNSKFMAFSNKDIEVKDAKRLILDLNNPKNFKDCSTDDRAQAELFLSEGNSAGGTEGRNSKYQALYNMRGVPVNVVTTKDKLPEAREKLKNNNIFGDIIKILGLTPNQTDFSNLRYGKVMIMVDADSAGAHIANIVISNFWVFNPAFVESGILHIATSPLYGLVLKGGSKNRSVIYKKTADEILNALAEYVYYKAFDIKISNHLTSEVSLLDKKYFIEVARIISYIGNLMNDIAEEHYVNPLILERLIPVLEDTKDLKNFNLDKAREVFGNTVEYNPNTKVLSMTLGREDIIISLIGLKEAISKELLPFLKAIAFRHYSLLVTTKFTDTYKDHPMSFIQIFYLFKTLENHFFKIERYKGLGSLPAKDRGRLCMDPEHRVVVKITSVGDAEKLINYMGNDSTYRKELLFSRIG
jgi:DNA gyrase/topoisomerase IV subunit B